MEFADALARRRDWLAEWTPGQPFDNAFELPSQSPFAEPHPNASGNSSHMPEKERAALPSRTIAASCNIELSGRTELARLAASTATHLSRTPASACHATQQLLEGVASVTQSAAKQRALRRAMGQCSMHVRARLLRFRPDAVPGDLEDWREQVAVLLERRLLRVARNRKLGLLLSSLALHEVELETIFRNSDYAALERRTSPTPPPVVDVTPAAGSGNHERHPPVPRALSVALAERAVGYWLSAMRRAARSDRLCREIGISPWMLEHLVDEVGMGGLRLGLVRHVAEVIEAQVIRRHQGARTFAKVVGTVLHGFLQKLNVEISDNARGAAASYAESQQRTARERVASRIEGEALPNFADQWCKRLRSFIADNIAAAPYWSSSASNDDLARLLSEFSSSPIEVEL